MDYTMEISVYFAEDEKEHIETFYGSTVENLKNKVTPQYINHIGKQYSMLPGEVVITCTICHNGEYVDSEEIFAEYHPRKILDFAIA